MSADNPESQTPPANDVPRAHVTHGAKTATPVSKELIKLLSHDHSQKQIAQLTGVSYDNVRQIVSRYRRESKQNTVSHSVTPTVHQVAKRLENEIADLKARSTSALARYSAEASEEATRLPRGKKLKAAGLVRQVAGIYSTVWPGDTGMQTLNLNVLNLGDLGIEIRPKQSE